jgi:hypothetical protein
VAERTPDGPARLLEEARGLATEGAIVMAHRKLGEIPQDSTLRQSDDFKNIERRWADEIFKAADESPDPQERRSLLDKVAKTPEVDAERRLKAANELAKLDEGVEAVDVADLPKADAQGAHAKPAPKPPAPVATAAAVTNKPKLPPTPPRRPHSSAPGKGRTGEEAEGANAAAEAPPPAPKPAAKPQQDSNSAGADLIRNAPF